MGALHAFDTDHQRVLRELIDNVEGAKQPPVVRAILHEIIGPDMIWAFWPETNTGAVPYWPVSVKL